MADRAYLYSSDRDEDEPWDRRERVVYPYCDSRWTIPMAWFFFFSEPDVRLVQIAPDDEWCEVKFRTDRRQALYRFQERLPLLSRLVGDRFDPSIIKSLFTNVSAFPGAFLVMDPDDVFGGIAGGIGNDDEWHFARCRRIVRLLGTPKSEQAEIVEAVGCYCATDYTDLGRFYENVIGAAYSGTVNEQGS